MELDRALKHLEDAKKTLRAGAFNFAVDGADTAVEAAVRALLAHTGTQTEPDAGLFDMLKALEKNGYAICEKRAVLRLRDQKNRIKHRGEDASRADAQNALSVAGSFISEVRRQIATRPEPPPLFERPVEAERRVPKPAPSLEPTPSPAESADL